MGGMNRGLDIVALAEGGLYKGQTNTKAINLKRGRGGVGLTCYRLCLRGSSSFSILGRS